MYVPAQFRPVSGSEIREFMSNGRFGILVTAENGLPVATHIPFEAIFGKDDEMVLEGHLSAANPQAGKLTGTGLAIFSGPDAYISSSWYDHPNVPTWNYIAVHAYGNIEELRGAELYDMMERQLSKHEKSSEKPVTMQSLPADYLNSHLKGIRCFRMRCTKIEAAFKLSQNRSDKDHAAIIEELMKGTTAEQEIALQMKKMRGS